MEKQERLVLRIGGEGGGQKIYEQKVGEDFRFVTRSNVMTFNDEMDEVWIDKETIYETLEYYWKELLKYNNHNTWFYFNLSFVHDDYKNFIAEKVKTVDKSRLTEIELFKLYFWEKMVK
jgi:hypothetical protein